MGSIIGGNNSGLRKKAREKDQRVRDVVKGAEMVA
jgi:hypothetical protein